MNIAKKWTALLCVCLMLLAAFGTAPTAEAASGPSLRTTLTDNATQRGSKKTFDVWARNAAGSKIKATVKFNGEKLNPTWDDNEKSSYTLVFTQEGENVVTVSASSDGGQKQELTYHITYRKAAAGEAIGSAVWSVEAFTLGSGYVIPPVRVPIYEGETSADQLIRLLHSNGLIGYYGGTTKASFYLAYIADGTVSAVKYNGYQKSGTAKSPRALDLHVAIPQLLTPHLQRTMTFFDPDDYEKNWRGYLIRHLQRLRLDVLRQQRVPECRVCGYIPVGRRRGARAVHAWLRRGHRRLRCDGDKHPQCRFAADRRLLRRRQQRRPDPCTLRRARVGTADACQRRSRIRQRCADHGDAQCVRRGRAVGHAGTPERSGASVGRFIGRSAVQRRTVCARFVRTPGVIRRDIVRRAERTPGFIQRAFISPGRVGTGLVRFGFIRSRFVHTRYVCPRYVCHRFIRPGRIRPGIRRFGFVRCAQFRSARKFVGRIHIRRRARRADFGGRRAVAGRNCRRHGDFHPKEKRVR